MTPGEIAQALLEAGYDPGPIGLGEALREFQAAHVGPDGHRLAVDGIFGPRTAWALAHPGAKDAPQGHTAPSWRRGDDSWPDGTREALSAAVAEIGVREDPDGSNRGPRVDVFTTPDLGTPWCAWFVSWAWSRRDGGSPFGRIGGVHRLWDWGAERGRLVTSPRPGDVFLILRNEVHGHCGLVCAVEEGACSTVEGNASNAVRGLVRPRSSLTHFLRPIGDLA